MNKVVFLGRIGVELELKEINGSSVTSFSLANTRKFKDKEETTWIRCDAFGVTAENIVKFFNKGSEILIEGRLRNNSWTDKDEVKHSTINVTVERFYFTGGSRKE